MVRDDGLLVARGELLEMRGTESRSEIGISEALEGVIVQFVEHITYLGMHEVDLDHCIHLVPIMQVLTIIFPLEHAH